MTDEELWKKWKRSKSSMDMEALLKALHPLIQSEVNRHGTIARGTLDIQAKKLAIDAIGTYDPNRGVKLSTHVMNRLQKLRRVLYTHQNAGRLPESSMLQYQTWQFANQEFRDSNGRDPSMEELADAMKMSVRKVTQLNDSFSRGETLETLDSPTGTFIASEHNPTIDYAYFSMSPRQQKIFELAAGYRGTRIHSNKEIMKKLGITQGVLSYEKNKINGILRDAI